MKKLIHYATGKQELRDVPEGTTFYTSAQVLWSEEKDGQFPADKTDKVGYLTRVNNHLQEDAVAKAALQAKLQAEAAAQAEDLARRTRILTYDITKTNSVAELRPIVLDLLVEVRRSMNH